MLPTCGGGAAGARGAGEGERCVPAGGKGAGPLSCFPARSLPIRHGDWDASKPAAVAPTVVRPGLSSSKILSISCCRLMGGGPMLDVQALVQAAVRQLVVTPATAGRGGQACRGAEGRGWIAHGAALGRPASVAAEPVPHPGNGSAAASEAHWE